jgi:hypothetical protein
MSIDNRTHPKSSEGLAEFTQPTLGNSGLYVGREMLPGQLDAVIEAVATLPQFELRTHFHINLLDKRDVRQQRPIHDVTVESAKARLLQSTTAFTTFVAAEVEDAGLIPRYDDQGSIVIIDFYDVTQDELLDEHEDMQDGLESFNPDGDYYWGKYQRPGLVIGSVWPHNTGQERRQVREAVANNLPDVLNFNPADF